MRTIVVGTGGTGAKTAAAGTPITQHCPPKKGCRTRLNQVRYTPGTTPHTLTAMVPVGRTTAPAGAVAGTAVVLAADPGPAGNGIAASDWVSVELANGRWHVSTVGAWTAGTLTLTLNTALPSAAKNGGRVFMFGVPGDTVPETGGTQAAWPTTASTALDLNVPDGQGFFGTYFNNDPILFHSDNATVAGALTLFNWVYTQEFGSDIPSLAAGPEQGYGDSGGDEGPFYDESYGDPGEPSPEATRAQEEYTRLLEEGKKTAAGGNGQQGQQPQPAQQPQQQGQQPQQGQPPQGAQPPQGQPQQGNAPGEAQHQRARA